MRLLKRCRFVYGRKSCLSKGTKGRPRQIEATKFADDIERGGGMVGTEEGQRWEFVRTHSIDVVFEIHEPEKEMGGVGEA